MGQRSRLTRVGVIADTHGLLRPQALAALRGSQRIIHAGDVGRPEVLAALAEIAPVHAVRGNVDRGAWAEALPETEAVQIEDAWLWVLHDRQQLDLDPAAAGFAAVIFEHSHQPAIEQRDGVLYLNPGSAGPRRFKLPVTIARLEVRGNQVRARLVELEASRK